MNPSARHERHARVGRQLLQLGDERELALVRRAGQVEALAASGPPPGRRRRLAGAVAAGQQPAVQRAPRDHAHAVALARRQHRRPRCRGRRSSTAAARRGTARGPAAPRPTAPRRSPRPETSTSRGSAPCPGARGRTAPTACRRCPSTGRGGAPGRGRCSPCRGGADCSPPHARSTAGSCPAGSGPRPSAPWNFVASTMSSRRPASALPTIVLGLAGRVHVGRVDEVDAGVERPVDDPDAVVVVRVAHRPEHHRSEAQRTDLDSGGAERAVAHGSAPRSRARRNRSLWIAVPVKSDRRVREFSASSRLTRSRLPSPAAMLRAVPRHIGARPRGRTRGARDPWSSGALRSSRLRSSRSSSPSTTRTVVLDASVRRLHDVPRTRGFPFSWRITIVDNAITDGTWAIAGRLAGELDGVHARAPRPEGPRPRAARGVDGERRAGRRVHGRRPVDRPRRAAPARRAARVGPLRRRHRLPARARVACRRAARSARSSRGATT